MNYQPLGQMPTCLTQAQHDEAVYACKQRAVKGLGALPNYDPCALAKLPICPPPVRWTPPPINTAINTPPPASEPVEPQPSTEPETKPESSPNYMLWGGLLLLVVLAGGYVVYKATR
jgi:hypothetical protein